MSFSFSCQACGERHDGMPALAADAPLYYYAIPEEEREERCSLDTELCVVDGEFYFVRSNILIPVHGIDEPFMWGVWVSLSRDNIDQYRDHFEDPDRARLGPYFGWLSASFLVYPDSENLKTMVHVQPPDERPHIELEPTSHPLAVEQREGISQERLAEIYATYLHS
ncbi:MAG: DUF2199 domain-containing protein [Erythrobacter sp.]